MFRSPIADAVIALVVILLFVGPKRLPMLSRSVGESIKEFKGGIEHREDKQHLDAAPSSQSATETSEKRETVS